MTVSEALVASYIEAEAGKRQGEVRIALLAVASNVRAGLHEDDTPTPEEPSNAQ